MISGSATTLSLWFITWKQTFKHRQNTTDVTVGGRDKNKVKFGLDNKLSKKILSREKEETVMDGDWSAPEAGDGPRLGIYNCSHLLGPRIH